MALPGDSILVSFVESEPIGKCFARHRDDWPYHVTLIPWFRVSDEVALERVMETYAQNRAGFFGEIGRQSAFGVQGDIPVSLLKEVSDFANLHTELLAAVRSVGATDYDTRWLGQSYTPHVTRHKKGREGFEPGYRFAVNGFYKVRLIEAETCRVESYHAFGRNA